MTLMVCRIAGFALLAVGLIGFAEPALLGMHLTPIHNVVHLATGALALYFGYAAPHGAKRFAIAFGSIYLLLGVLGFVAPGVVGTVIGHGEMINAGALMPDNVVHLLLGGLFLVVGLAASDLPGHTIRVGRA
jgi:hypothetical protein